MPLARFLLRLFLVLGLQNLSLTPIGLRHVQVSLRDFDVGSGLRHALSLVRLLTEKLGFLHHRPTPALRHLHWPTRNTDSSPNDLRELGRTTLAANAAPN